jgi:hypothetical protein
MLLKGEEILGAGVYNYSWEMTSTRGIGPRFRIKLNHLSEFLKSPLKNWKSSELPLLSQSPTSHPSLMRLRLCKQPKTDMNIKRVENKFLCFAVVSPDD